MYAGFSQATKADSRFILHPRRNLRFHGFLLNYAAFTSTFAAWIADGGASTLASRASARNAEEALLVSHLSTAGAGMASGGRFAVGATRPPADFAILVPAIDDFLLRAENRFFELQRNVFA
jgi:hypothetical protein